MFSKQFAGIDACRKGWLLIYIDADANGYCADENLEKIINNFSQQSRILVDMPIGLLEKKSSAFIQRPCDTAARKILGKKHSSIFSPPSIEALYEKSYEDASRVNFEILGKKLSKQSWNIASKIRELNAFLHLNSNWRGKVLESHPELAFQFLNDNKPLKHSKKTREGISERIHILDKQYPLAGQLYHSISSDSTLKSRVAKDDIADALCLAVLNYTRGKNLQNISEEYPEDSLGNRMGIWL